MKPIKISIITTSEDDSALKDLTDKQVDMLLKDFKSYSVEDLLLIREIINSTRS